MPIKFAHFERESVYRRVASHFEGLIRSGEIGRDEKVPPTAELADKFGVTVDTMQKGLSLLARKGILVRKRKIGTFVNPSTRATCVGIVLCGEVFSSSNRLYATLLGTLLKQFKKRAWGQGWGSGCKI